MSPLTEINRPAMSDAAPTSRLKEVQDLNGNEKEAAVRVLEVVRVANIVYEYALEERMNLPVPKRAIRRAYRADQLGAIIRCPVRPHLVIAKADVLFRIPAFPLAVAKTGNLSFNRPRQFVPSKLACRDVIGVSLTL